MKLFSKAISIATILGGILFSGSLLGQDPHFAQFYSAPIQTNPAMERAFAGWHGAALSWDGSNPVRPFM